MSISEVFQIVLKLCLSFQVSLKGHSKRASAQRNPPNSAAAAALSPGSSGDLNFSINDGGGAQVNCLQV